MAESGLDAILDKVSYSDLESYKPSKFAIEFVEFIKLVNGGKPENKTPVFHYKLIDSMVHNVNTLAVCFRGSAKSTFFEYFILYLAVFGKIVGFSDIQLGMYVSDTMENGVKNMRNNLEFRYNHSDFLRTYIPKVKFTDPEWEFTNVEGHELTFRGFGISTGVRGFKKYGIRPQVACHKKGTIITTEYGTHKVEDYPGIVFPINRCYGLDISIYGLTDIETVTHDHKYLCKTITSTRKKEHISNGKTRSSTIQTISDLHWIEAKDLKFRKKTGNHRYESDYIAKKIDYSVFCVKPILYPKCNIIERDDNGRILSIKYDNCYKICMPMLCDSFWWIYGMWLANGHQTYNCFCFTLPSSSNKKDIVETLYMKAAECGIKIGKHVVDVRGYFQFSINSRAISRWLREYHTGNAIKNMPEWVLHLDFGKQKEILLGYIAGDGYIDYKNNQIRINSVNLNVLKQLGVIAERLGLPYHIRNTKREGIESFPDGQVCNVRRQWEIRFRDNVREILGFDIDGNPRDTKECFIDDGYIFRKFKNSIPTDDPCEFVPINTPSHTYQTDFGVSHNCLDDLMSDRNADSRAVTEDIENVIYKAIRQAMHPTKRRVMWAGTPFNMKDPLYRAAGSSSWYTVAFPICERWPCERDEFVGAWEDRFNYDFVKNEYDLLKANGKVDAFNQELMLRILSDDDRLLHEQDIVWKNRADMLSGIQSCNVYITTDFATSETEKSDFSVISVWALDADGVFNWVDGIVVRQNMAKNIDDLFRLVEIYHPLSVGVEISGQQKGFINWIRREMNIRNKYFNLATDKTSGEEGLRPNTSKLTRFNIALPLFKQRKIAFPGDLRESPAMVEFMEELMSVTAGGFKSAHDDCADTISQIPLIEYFVPGRNVNPEPVKSKYERNVYYFTASESYGSGSPYIV